jgi:hypothetical protein
MEIALSDLLETIKMVDVLCVNDEEARQLTKEYSLKKIQYYRLKNKKFYIKNLRFFKKYSVCKKRFFYLKKLIKLILIKLLNKKHKNYKNNLNSLFIINIFIEKILRSNLLKIQKNLKKLRR